MTWLQGKKTFIGGAVMILAAILGVAFGRLPAEMGLALLGFGFSAIGLGDKANRHQAELLSALNELATIRTGSGQKSVGEPAK